MAQGPMKRFGKPEEIAGAGNGHHRRSNDSFLNEIGDKGLMRPSRSHQSLLVDPRHADQRSGYDLKPVTRSLVNVIHSK